MENFLGWMVIIAFPVGVIASVGYIIYRHRKEMQRLDAEFKQRNEKFQQDYEKHKARASRLGLNKPTPDSFARSYSSTARSSTATTSSTASTPAKDWSDDLLTTMIIADMLTNHKDTVAGTVKWDNDVPTITESKPSSWGLEDSDSRSSASSTFSSSDSSSSWDSSSSSSDSGPSSDW